MANRKKTTRKARYGILPRLTIGFFERPFITACIWLSLLVFGFASYATLLKREGFPSVNVPFAIVSGTYFVNDPAKVDQEVAKPLSEVALAQNEAKIVQATSAGNFFSVIIQYAEGTDARVSTDRLRQEVERSNRLPRSAGVEYNVPYFGATGGDIRQIDVAISFYDPANRKDLRELTAAAEKAAEWLESRRLPDVKSVFVKSPFEQVRDPASGQSVTLQRSFDRYGTRLNGDNRFFNSVIIGVAANPGTDVITLDEEVRRALEELKRQPEFQDYQAAVSASFAPAIEDNLHELQRVLLEGLLAVLVVGSLVIAVRASLITVISMVTVLLATLGFLYAIGFTLNVITLFALILGLALIVDDTIIMVEAIDAARFRYKDRRRIVLEATQKISRAMMAATLTASLSFAPLLFVGGILGEFIQAIPITLISALIISLIVALVFIPFLSRFLLLSKKQLGKKATKEVAAGFEAWLARVITKPMVWARSSRIKLASVIILAIGIGFGFFAGGLFIARNVVFNIFPPTKDTNGLVLNFQFPPSTTVDQAETIAERAETILTDVLGLHFVQSSYFGSGDDQSATLQVQITPYSKREVTSRQLVDDLQQRFNRDFKEARIAVAQLDVGPPSAPFTVQVTAQNREAAYRLANDVAAFMNRLELRRPNGTTARLTNVNVSNPGQYIRYDGRPIVTVNAGFDASDTTTLVLLAQNAIRNEFPNSRLAGYGLEDDDLSFDIGQESENQESFRTLAVAFPILLLVMYLLLAAQFASLLQPLLIFMAIPFSIFGVMLGLDLTDNAISFFSMLGFFALVGLSIKNTILLTDYANRARRTGKVPIDAAAEALQERFRPLFATSMTAVVSLVPLAITSPFWEGLAVVLIFGLLSSTFLVVTVFPYYYLAGEWLRDLGHRAWVRQLPKPLQLALDLVLWPFRLVSKLLVRLFPRLA